MTNQALQNFCFGGQPFSIVEEPQKKQQYLLDRSPTEWMPESLIETLKTRAYAGFFKEMFEAEEFYTAELAAVALRAKAEEEGDALLLKIARRAEAAARRGQTGRPWRR